MPGHRNQVKTHPGQGLTLNMGCQSTSRSTPGSDAQRAGFFLAILGGYGFIRELGDDGFTYGVEAIYRDAKMGEIYERAFQGAYG